jgi:hypothetical protein
MKVYNFKVMDIAYSMNQAREIFIDYLESEKICSEEQAKEFRETLSFVVVEQGWLGNAIDKLMGFTKDDQQPRIKLVRILK